MNSLIGKKKILAAKDTGFEAWIHDPVMRPFEFLRVLCGFSFANFAVKSSCSRRTSKDFNRKGHEGDSAKYAKKFKLTRCRQPSW